MAGYDLITWARDTGNLNKLTAEVKKRHLDKDLEQPIQPGEHSKAAILLAEAGVTWDELA